MEADDKSDGGYGLAVRQLQPSDPFKSIQSQAGNRILHNKNKNGCEILIRQILCSAAQRESIARQLRAGSGSEPPGGAAPSDRYFPNEPRRTRLAHSRS